MIMMRSTSVTKMAKPPPPIPPRPSKALVAEALAKSRRSPVNGRGFETTDRHLSPTRSAPPPPFGRENENTFAPVVKSQSYAAVNLMNRAPKVQRSTSNTEEERKESSRTVVFQSSNLNLKTSKIEVTLKRNDSDRMLRSVKNNTNGVSSSGEEANVVVKPDVSHAELIAQNDTNVLTNGINRHDEFRTEPKWNDLLNGKNHVNTLIDEMFASILDIPDEKSELPEAFNENVNGVQLGSHFENNEILISSDKTQIIVGNCSDGSKDIADVTATMQSKVSKEVTELQPSTTVLVIDDISNDQDNKNNTEDVKTEHNELELAGNHENSTSSSSTSERTEKRVKFDDKKNHELLIAELENMRMEQDRILKRQRKPSQEFYDDSSDELPKIHHSDWVEVNDGQEVRLSSCQIIIEDGDGKNADTLVDPVISRLNMSSLHGLPPLPKSLSGFSLLENQRNPQTPNRTPSARGPTPPTPSFVSGQVVYPPHPRAVNGTPDPTSGRKATNLDNQLAILRREMYSLRQLDLSLLSQLWSLNESIQDFRQILQEQDDRALSPPSPSPSPSSCDDGEADEFFSPTPMRLRPAPPPPPLRRTSNSSSANSSEYGTV